MGALEASVNETPAKTCALGIERRVETVRPVQRSLGWRRGWAREVGWVAVFGNGVWRNDDLPQSTLLVLITPVDTRRSISSVARIGRAGREASLQSEGPGRTPGSRRGGKPDPAEEEREKHVIGVRFVINQKTLHL